MPEPRGSTDLLMQDGGLERALERGIGHLLGLQSPEGYWWGELESNASITSEHVFLRHILGNSDPDETRKVAAYLLATQRPDGTWANWYEGPGDLSTTIEAYVALKLARIPSDRAEMARAREFILDRGGVEKARVFTKIWLALLGEWDWRGTPMLPPELVLLPAHGPISIYDFGCWARGTIVPMAIIQTIRPVFPLPRWAHIDELFVRGKAAADRSLPARRRTGWSRLFLALDRVLRIYDRSPWKPFRGLAIRRAVRWIVDRQEADGSWGGIQPPWVYSLIALRSLGRGMDDPVMAKGFGGFYGPKGFAIEEADTFRLQSCLSPVWDTALAAVALEEAGLSPDHPALRRAGEWLLDEQITEGGDWQVRSHGAPGGWAFEFANDTYPDTDDSSLVMMALAGADLDEDRKAASIRRGVDWLLAMQSSNGGWGAFDRNNTKTFLRQIPFADFGEMVDPPSADVTAHILELLGRFGRRRGDRAVDRALAYLLREQDPDGAWFGRWGVNLTYGIGAVLPALAAVGVPADTPPMRRAVVFLVEHQNQDGGWGERIEGYSDPAWRGHGPSTASQTAWALLGLLAAGEVAHPATARGVAFLVRTQKETGGWNEPYFTGTGFPTDFMINYHLYRDVFPVMALGRYQRALDEESR
jgi:squalene-hopene/tetraprenyl-beta-curcumene cyclase